MGLVQRTGRPTSESRLNHSLAESQEDSSRSRKVHTCIKLRATRRKVSKTSSPFAEQPEKKMTRTVTMQKPVRICSGRECSGGQCEEIAD